MEGRHGRRARDRTERHGRGEIGQLSRSPRESSPPAWAGPSREGCPLALVRLLFLVIAITAVMADSGRRLTDADQGEWLGTADLAAMLNVEIASIYWLNHTGEGPPRYKIGRELRYRRSEVDEWAKTRRVPVQPGP